MSTLPEAHPPFEPSALSLSDELIITALAQEGNSEWFLCRHPSSGEKCVLTTAASEAAQFQVSQLLKNEYLLRDNLSTQWALKPSAHTLYHGRYALIYPDFAYQTLADMMREQRPSLESFLHSAAMLAGTLGMMHQQGLIHGDIKPAHFFVSGEGGFRLGGFGLSCSASEVLLQTQLPASGGTLAYMSPEHTTRTTQRVSSLSDLYSLGIVLYELLTGKLPFGAPGAGHSEWVHHHIASEPLPPERVRHDVPAVVSAIVLRLLCKSPEQRYQSAEGLQADLRRCLSLITPDGQIEGFDLGSQDLPQTGPSSDVMYYDHPQAQEVLDAFERFSHSGKHKLVMIGGALGSGKTSLIASAAKKLQQKKLLLTVVKADRHSPILPHGILISAIRTLTLQLMGLPAMDIARWRAHFTRLLGDYSELAIHFFPELGVLLNQKGHFAVDIHSLDARDRFNTMACSMIKAFATPGRPLVMMIDDIHWADRASLALLQNLLSQSEDIPLMVVVSHKDFATLPCQTMRGLLTTLRESAVRVTDITPQSLSIKQIARRLAGMFHVRASATCELARVVHEKTGGNPLFTQEFIRQAVQHGLISHRKFPLTWHYDLDAIKACQYSENVASLVLQRMEIVPEITRRVLSSLACLGGSGGLTLPGKVLNLTQEEIRMHLLPAAVAQLITLHQDDYAFTHDRVHEAAINLIGTDEKDRLHLRAASLLAERANEDLSNDALFRVVHHVAAIKNTGLLHQSASRYRQLILLATRRAKSTGDYVSALRFLQATQRMDAPLTAEEDFTFTLEAAECEFLHGNLSTAQGHCTKLLSAPGNPTDKAIAACMMAEIHMRRSDSKLALETAIAWLAVFGIHLNREPDKAECDAARIKLKEQVGKNPYTRLRPLPLMTCRKTEAIMNLMASACMFAAFVSPRLHFMIVCKMLHLTMDKGMTGASTFALSWYGVLCGDHYNEYSRGFASTLLARELVYKHDFTSFKARTLLPLDQVSIWTMPTTYSIECAKTTFDTAVAVGDRTSACLALRHLVMNYLTRGDHLEGVQTSIERGLAYVSKAQYRDVEVILQMQRDYVLFLRFAGDEPFSGKNFTPVPILQMKPGTAIEPLLLMQFWSWLYRGMAHFFAGEYACASDCFAQAAPLTGSIPGHIHRLDFHLYSALSVTIPLTSQTCTEEHRQFVAAHYEMIATWAVENPRTFADKAGLLRAEMLRLEGDSLQAAQQYELAITLSREGRFDHINGLACELAAGYASTCGLSVAADGYIKGAMAAWERWGAGAKVRQLELRYPHHASSQRHAAFSTVSFEQSAELSDLQSVITAVRALTEEINLDRLINTLMMMLLERAGAQHCLLIRLLDGSVPEIEARAATTADGIRVKIVQETPLATDLPLSVLSAVIRTGQEIRTGKPEVFSPFSQDPYLVASGAAVMCVPMFKQARMVGVLYLENRLMPDVFTAEHSRVVSMLGAQAAVSLETARLYAELMEENVNRRRVEKQLRASQTSLIMGEKISHTGTWHWNLAKDQMMISEEYRRILGLPQEQTSLSMVEFMTMVHPDDHGCISELVRESVIDGVSMQAEFRIIRRDGECRYIKGIGDPVENLPDVSEYFGTISDITSQRLAEDAVRIAQADLARVSRATTVGQLTASIAHEINQPLMSIVANAGASMRWIKRGPEHIDNACHGLQEILSEGKRAGDIIRGLQALTRNQLSEFAPAKLHHLARDILSLSRMELERRWISLDLDLRAMNDNIYCERVQIQQVLLNLVVNAIDAMVEKGRGSSVLKLSSCNPTPDTILFEVADNGTGLSDEVILRIFDSFYTTKKEGMGMGLTISEGIIKRHKGELKAENRAEGGSRFWFTLPTEAESPHPVP